MTSSLSNADAIEGSGSLTDRELLEKIFNALDIGPNQRGKMIQQVEGIIRIKLTEKLFKNLDQGEHENLHHQLRVRTPQEQQELFEKYSKDHLGSERRKDRYLKEVYLEVIPDYIATLLTVATEEQKQKVKTLLLLLTSQQAA